MDANLTVWKKDFDVLDGPADFGASLEVALTASALPALDSVIIARQEEHSAPKIQLYFARADETTMTAFATAMKPALVAGDWHVWINAGDRYVESFDAQDSITLEEQLTRGVIDPAGEQKFADTLVRVWDDAPTS